MSERNKHLFSFTADRIAKAALEEAKYHKSRIEFWEGEQERAMATLRKTAKIEFREMAVTGGKRMEMFINYGDTGAHARLLECGHKLDLHRAAAARFESDAQVYVSQHQDHYQLDTDDVHHFRLSGKPREE